MIVTLDDFIKEYRKIQDMGWVTTHRPGNTGIGKTLEDLLGIAENNFQEPDFGEYELKASRVNNIPLRTNGEDVFPRRNALSFLFREVVGLNLDCIYARIRLKTDQGDGDERRTNIFG